VYTFIKLNDRRIPVDRKRLALTCFSRTGNRGSNCVIYQIR